MDALYKNVVVNIKNKINDGSLPEGQKLPSERELSIEYNVSRNVVREAIRVLSDEGLLAVYPGKGSYVTKPNPFLITETIERVMKNYNTTLENILEIREDSESSIIKKVMEKASSEDIRTLYEIYEDIERNTVNVTEFVRLDIQFHLYLAKCTKNPLYPVLLQSFIEMTQHVLFEFTKLFPESMEQAQEHHLELIKAIEKRNELTALKIMKAHMHVLREEIDVLKKRKLISTNISTNNTFLEL